MSIAAALKKAQFIKKNSRKDVNFGRKLVYHGLREKRKMGKKLCLALVVLAINVEVIFSQQILFKIGDNITDYLGKNPPQYLTQGTFFIDAPDGRVDFLKYKAETTDIDTKFLVQGSTVFGVMQYEDGETSLLYDIDGDGVLDFIWESLFLPFSVLTESSYTKISGNNNLSGFLDNGFKMYNDDSGPFAPDANSNFLLGFSTNIDISTENRDLFYGMLQYYNFVPDPELAFMVIYSVGMEYEQRFGVSHPLIYLHIAESLINLGSFEYAVDFIDDILADYPDFVPAKVYSWQLDEDAATKQRKYNELKAKHPNHWIVKQI